MVDGVFVGGCFYVYWVVWCDEVVGVVVVVDGVVVVLFGGCVGCCEVDRVFVVVVGGVDFDVDFVVGVVGGEVGDEFVYVVDGGDVVVDVVEVFVDYCGGDGYVDDVVFVFVYEFDVLFEFGVVVVVGWVVEGVFGFEDDVFCFG